MKTTDNCRGRMRPWLRAPALGLILLVTLAGACSGEEGKKGGFGSGPSPVLVASVERADVPVTVSAIGSVEAINEVSIKSQVAGTLKAVHFEEGRHVEAGAPLFTIDPEPFRIAVEQARAQLERDRAQAELARSVAERSRKLHQQDVISKESYERDRSAAAALAATVKSDRAALERAELELSYCDISSPIAGVAGDLLVTRGNLIKSQDVVMTTVVQTAPIYVSFTVAQSRLAEIKKFMRQGTLAVSVTIPGEALPETGTVTFVDNAIDVNTGTILLKATCPNAAERLWPGQYVEVTLALTSHPGALVVPTAAVQTRQEGPFVFVVKPDKTVAVAAVTPGVVFGDTTEITEGLAAGETVVTQGQLRLRPGSRVEIKEAVDDAGPAKQ